MRPQEWRVNRIAMRVGLSSQRAVKAADSEIDNEIASSLRAHNTKVVIASTAKQSHAGTMAFPGRL